MRRGRRVGLRCDASLHALCLLVGASIATALLLMPTVLFVSATASPARGGLIGCVPLDGLSLSTAVEFNAAFVGQRTSCTGLGACLARGCVDTLIAAAKARRDVGRRAAPWEALQDAVGGVVKGMVDPEYWKRQLFLQEKLREVLPNRQEITALHFMPEDHVHLGYLTPKEDSGSELKTYIAVGDLDEKLRSTIANQGTVTKVPITFVEYAVGKPTALTKACVDVALLSAGSAAKLGPQLPFALKEMRRLLKFDGRMIIVANERDEAAIGGTFEAIIQGQDLADADELEDLTSLSAMDMADGQVLRQAGFRLVQIIGQDWAVDVKMGVLLPREESPKLLQKQLRAKKAARGDKRARNQRGRSGTRGGSSFLGYRKR